MRGIEEAVIVDAEATGFEKIAQAKSAHDSEYVPAHS